MTSPSPGDRRKFSGKDSLSSGRKRRNLLPEKHSGLVRRLVSAPLTLKLPLPTIENGESPLRPSKLLLNVTIENSLGALRVLMSPEDTVGDLIKATLVFYKREKRRPFLKNTDPKCYNLHYSQFSFQIILRRCRFEARREVNEPGVKEFLSLHKAPHDFLL